METDVLTFELVLRDAVHRRSQIRHRQAKLTVAEIQIRLRSRPPHIQVARLRDEGPAQRVRDRRRRRREITDARVPVPRPVRDHWEQVIDRLHGEPVRDLPVDPLRLRGLRRGQQHEPRGFVECALDRRPQLRTRRKAGLVTEDPQRLPTVPGLCHLLQAPLQRRRQSIIGRVAVRNEPVVDHATHPGSSERSVSHALASLMTRHQMTLTIAVDLAKWGPEHPPKTPARVSPMCSGTLREREQAVVHYSNSPAPNCR